MSIKKISAKLPLDLHYDVTLDFSIGARGSPKYFLLECARIVGLRLPLAFIVELS